eukprot:m.289192 g.289192  ORF g.289192 m.289192 type:complete len:315 (+) comp55062_c0_seq3:293-1237(+)
MSTPPPTRLLSDTKPPAFGVFARPPSERVVVVGDIHGHIDKLRALWRQLETFLKADFKAYQVVFLGDYVDRGPDTRAVLDFLCELKESRPNTAFIAGNHDLALAAFLGLLTDPVTGSDDLGWTWDRSDIWVRPGERETWYAGPGYQQMHLQGRRYVTGTKDSIYTSRATFQSYGVGYGDRAGLVAAMPATHQQFLRELPWVHQCPGYIFAHAGLEEASEKSTARQLEDLRLKTISPRPEALCGRDSVIDCPEDTSAVIVSGHHHCVHFERKRIILDRCGGFAENELEAIILPSFKGLTESGRVFVYDIAHVFVS